MPSLPAPMSCRKPFSSGYPYSILMKKALTTDSRNFIITYPHRYIGSAVAHSSAEILMNDGRFITRPL